MLYCLSHKLGHSNRLLHCNRTFIERVLKVYAVNQIEDQEVTAARKTTQSVDAYDSRMVHASQQTGFLDKLFDGQRVLLPVLVKCLDCHNSPEAFLDRAEDLSESAAAQVLLQEIVCPGQRCAWIEGSGCLRRRSRTHGDTVRSQLLIDPRKTFR